MPTDLSSSNNGSTKRKAIDLTDDEPESAVSGLVPNVRQRSQPTFDRQIAHNNAIDLIDAALILPTAPLLARNGLYAQPALDRRISVEDASKAFMLALKQFVDNVKNHVDREFISLITLELGMAHTEVRMRKITDTKYDNQLVSDNQAGDNKEKLAASAQSLYEISAAFGNEKAKANLIDLCSEHSRIEDGLQYRFLNSNVTTYSQLHAINKRLYDAFIEEFGIRKFFLSTMENHLDELSVTLSESASRIIAYLSYKFYMIIMEEKLGLPEVFSPPYIAHSFLKTAERLGGNIKKWNDEHSQPAASSSYVRR